MKKFFHEINKIIWRINSLFFTFHDENVADNLTNHTSCVENAERTQTNQSNVSVQ